MKKDILIYFDLITSLKTTQEVADLSSEIDIVSSLLFKSEEMSLGKAIESIGRSFGKKIMDIFSNNNFDVHDKLLVRDFLETLKDLIKKLKVIKLTLAFDPPITTIEKIHEYVSENIGIGYILDIEISESVLAGAIVTFNGKYKDFTLRKSLEETFEMKRKEIISAVG